MKTRLFFLVLMLFPFVNSLWAQKLFGGEIIVKQTGTYSAVATVYLTSAINSTYESIELCWGDGSCDEIPLSNSISFPSYGLKQHEFEYSHIYGYEDTFTLRVSSCCWASNIQNISLFESEPLDITTTFFMSILDPLFGENQMPELEYRIVDGNLYSPISYEANLYDAEGDEVIVSVCEVEYLDNYQQPTQIYPSQFNLLSLDTLSGDFQWTSPQLPGNYVFAFCVDEYRNDVLISSFLRNIVVVVDQPISNNNISLEEQVDVFPNPTEDFLQVDFPEHWNAVEMRLLDLNGRTLERSSADYSFNLIHLKKGMYLIEVRSENHFFIKKVILN